jgi:hypothetical protein
LKYLEAAEKVSNLFQIYFPLFFLALPQKRNQKSLVRLNLASRESQTLNLGVSSFASLRLCV